MSTPESEVKTPVRRPSHLNRDVEPGSFTNIKEYHVPKPEQRNVNLSPFYPVNLPPVFAEIPQPLPTTGWFELKWDRFKLEHMTSEEEELVELHAKKTLTTAPVAFVTGSIITGFVSRWVPRAKGIRIPVALLGGVANTCFHFLAKQANFDRIVLAHADEDSVLRRDTVRKYAHMGPLSRAWMEKEVEYVLDRNKKIQEQIDSGYFNELGQKYPFLAKYDLLYPHMTSMADLKLSPAHVEYNEMKQREAEELEKELEKERGVGWQQREREELEREDEENRAAVYAKWGMQYPPGRSIEPTWRNRIYKFLGIAPWM